MVDKTGWDLMQRKIDHRVGAYKHRIRSSFKFCDNPGQDAVVDVQVVGIKLDGELSAVAGVNRLVPASANSQVPAFGNDVLNARIDDSAQDFSRLIGRVVIDNDYVEIEISALDESASNGVENCPLAI